MDVQLPFLSFCNCEWVHKLPNGKHHAAITGSDVNDVNS